MKPLITAIDNYIEASIEYAIDDCHKSVNYNIKMEAYSVLSNVCDNIEKQLKELENDRHSHHNR